jgi:hypothetical protein
MRSASAHGVRTCFASQLTSDKLHSRRCGFVQQSHLVLCRQSAVPQAAEEGQRRLTASDVDGCHRFTWPRIIDFVWSSTHSRLSTLPATTIAWPVLLQDNAASDTEDEEEARWRRTVRAKELRDEREADEKDRLAELEEAAAARDANGDTNGGNVGGGGGRAAAAAGIVDASDGIMAAMLAQAAKPDAKVVAQHPASAGPSLAVLSGAGATAPDVVGGWSSAVPSDTGSTLRTAPAPVAKAAAIKKRFFDDGTEQQERKVGAWIMQEAAKREAAPAAQQVPAAANGGTVHAEAGSFDSERDAVRLPHCRNG